LEELSPHKTATELFGNPNSNTSNKNKNNNKRTRKIAIATRWGHHVAMKEYIDTLSSHGFEARWMADHSALEDFCAMRHATELVGTVRSTFVMWAGLLGFGLVRLYSVQSPATVEKAIQNRRPFFRTYNWTHPELQRRIRFELYQSEAMDEQQQQ
jgi:hypothetical protein